MLTNRLTLAAATGTIKFVTDITGVLDGCHTGGNFERPLVRDQLDVPL